MYICTYDYLSTLKNVFFANQSIICYACTCKYSTRIYINCTHVLPADLSVNDYCIHNKIISLLQYNRRHFIESRHE